jgi:hypothetical protein
MHLIINQVSLTAQQDIVKKMHRSKKKTDTQIIYSKFEIKQEKNVGAINLQLLFLRQFVLDVRRVSAFKQIIRFLRHS